MTHRKAPGLDDWLEIEQALHERVTHTRLEYELAIAEARKLLEEARQSSDGVSAIRRAKCVEESAMKQYSQALQAFCEFVLERNVE